MKQENWQSAARILLGCGLIFAGISHLTFRRKEFQAQVPDWVPLEKDDTVVYSGIAEIALGSAVLSSGKESRQMIGKIAAGFFAGVFPGNWAQFKNRRKGFGLDSDKKRLARLFLQPLLIYWALKSTKP